MFETGFEARGIRQVNDRFLNGNDSYVNILKRKINWIRSNQTIVQTYFEENLGISLNDDSSKLKSAFITFYPTVIDLVFSEIPCRSLIEFVEDFRENGRWPY